MVGIIQILFSEKQTKKNILENVEIQSSVIKKCRRTKSKKLTVGKEWLMKKRKVKANTEEIYDRKMWTRNTELKKFKGTMVQK